MYTILWLVATAFVGFECMIYFAPDVNPLIGASAGFGVGGSLRLAIITGSGEIVGALLEGIGELFSS